MSRLCSAPLPETLPDDVGLAALWEALASDPAALRAPHAADTLTEQPQELLAVLEDVRSHRELERTSLC